MTTAKSTLAQALLAAQASMPKVQKDGTNPHFRNEYATRDGIIAVLRPVLNDAGLVVSQFPTTLDGQPALRTRITHADTGEHVEDVMLLMLAKNDSQGQGSALTYASRYALMSIFTLATGEDDDGNKSSKPAPGRKPASRKKPPMPEPDDDIPFGPPEDTMPPAPGAKDTLVQIVGSLMGLGKLTEEQIQLSAKTEKPWPELLDDLTAAQVDDLTTRLARYLKNVREQPA